MRRLLAGLAAVVALLVAWRLLDVQHWVLAFVAYVRDAGAAGMLLFAAGYVLATVLFVPGLLLTMGAGLAYGVAVGSPLVWVSANLAAAAAFLLGRTLAREAIAARVAGDSRFAAIDAAVGREGFKIVLLTRLSPAFPFNLLNYAYGLTRVTFRDYVLASMIGMIPGTVMYVYLGSLLTDVAQLAGGGRAKGAVPWWLKAIGFLATVAVTIVVTRIARRALNEATARQPAQYAPPPAASPAPHAAGPLVMPDDEHDRTLLARVHPPGRRNPTPSGRYNLVVIGGGTAGLVSAAGGAGLGAKVALVERQLLGGDCLNVGCVPSKALIAAARAAAEARGAGALGVRTGEVHVDFPAVMERMRRLRAGIAANDSVERFTKLGVDVYLGQGTFTSPTSIEVDGQRLDFAKAVIATGARAASLDIPGLDDAGYLTNETVFWLTELPRRLAVIGGGPIGCELAQAFARFGSTVTLLNDTPHLLPREDGDAAAIVERRLAADGVRIVNRVAVRRVERRGAESVLHWERGAERAETACDKILLGVGRTPNLEGLGLEAAGVGYGRDGVAVNDQLQTTNARIYAAGDIASRFKFTHTADALARIVLANALFLGRRKASALTVPWCTYTSPEVAHVGLYEHEARERGQATSTITVPLRDVDRAILDGKDDGFLKMVLEEGSDAILGATLVAAHAGDMISEISVAMAAGLGLGKLANVIHPYPTQAEVIRKAGDVYNRTRLTPRVKRLFEWWLRRSRR